MSRLMKLLMRRCVLVQDAGQTYLAEPDAETDDARTLRPLQAAVTTYASPSGRASAARC
jgi:hypothetical protein